MIPGNLMHSFAALVLTLALGLAGGSAVAGGAVARTDASDPIGTAADVPRTAPPEPERAAPRVSRDAPRPPLNGSASGRKDRAERADDEAPLARRPHGQLTVPVKPGAFRVSQPFHRWHGGIDLAAPTGTPVLAVAPGRVTKVRTWLHSYGHHVVIRHAGGRSLAAHLSSIRVRKGQRVRPGQVIGRVGSTGNSTGPHLHFVLTKRGRTVDPAGYIWG